MTISALFAAFSMQTTPLPVEVSPRASVAVQTPSPAPQRTSEETFPGRRFYCRDCIAVDGLLAAYPQQAAKLDFVRIAYPRLRQAVIAAIGEPNQKLPVLVLAADAPADLSDGEHEGRRFVADFKRLLHALDIRHGFPEAHR
jgi:hypothetical protein